MKIAIIHDYFNSLGGGERLVLKLAKFFDADIYTYFLNKAKTYKEVENLRIETAKLPLKYYGLRQFLGIKHFEKLNLQNTYDLFIMSGYLSIFASELNHPNIWISGSALKHLFVPEFFRNEPLLKRIMIDLSRNWLKNRNEQIIKNSIDKILSYSAYQQKEVKRIFNVKSEVVYPPVETNRFYFRESRGYYLSVSRLERLKRIDLIINAFKKLPQENLIIVGDGSQKEDLQKLAEGYDNIKFIGAVNDDELPKIYAECTAFIYTSFFDDFSITSLEALASGKPVIAVNQGAVKEIVINRKMGLLISDNVEALMKAVKYLDVERSKAMKNDCIKRAKEFDEKIYFKKMENIIKGNLKY